MLLMLRLRKLDEGIVEAGYHLECDGYVGSVPTWFDGRFASEDDALAWALEIATVAGIPRERIFVEEDEVRA